jgi:type VI secretion system secreted protein Hcp
MAVNYFLKLAGIEGESADEAYKNQVQIRDWSWAANQETLVATEKTKMNAGLAAGKVDPGDFALTTYCDKATPKFFKSICTGQHIEGGTLTAIKAGDPKPYFKMDFKELFVTNLSLLGADENPTVSLSFSYAEIAMEYSAQDGKGLLASTGAVKYNRRQNKLS